MGNTESTSKEKIDNEKTISIDQLSKHDLLQYIRNKQFKKLVTGDDAFNKGINSVELYNTEIVSMSLELYDALETFCKEYESPIKKRQFKKYIPIEFTPHALRESVVNQNVIEFVPNNIEYLAKTYNFVKQFSTADITMTEYDESFADCLEKKDMIGMSKKILSILPNYHKNRILNAFNDYYSGENSSMEKMAFGAASFSYKEAKNGPKADISSYRKIIAIPNVVSHFHRILALRLYHHLKDNDIIDDSIQKGCVPGQKCPLLQQIIKVKSSINDAIAFKKKAAILYIDVSDAFGSINRECLTYVLKKYQVPDKFINYINNYYKNFEYYVRNKEITMESIKWKDGLVQGCPLSPILFITVLNYVLTYLDDKYRKSVGYIHSNKNQTNILASAYVDDICIILRDKEYLQDVYFELVEILKNIGMSINPAKSGIMLIGYTPEEVSTFNLDNIPIVTNYKYLGANISSTDQNLIVQNFNKELYGKLMYIDQKVPDDVEKCEKLHEYITPWIMRQMANMYDISSVEKNNILNVVLSFQKKWNDTISCDIFPDISGILESTTDNVLSTLVFSELSTNFEKNAEFTNYTTKRFSYNYNDVEKDEIPIENIISSV